MKLNQLLSLIAVLTFIATVIFVKCPRRFYLLYVLFLIPVMDLPITPPNLGGLKVFDGLSYLGFGIMFKDFFSLKKDHKIYYVLFCSFVIVLLIGSLTSLYIFNSLLSILTFLPVFIFARLLINECLADPEFRDTVIRCLKLVALLSILFLIIQTIVGLKFTFYVNLNRNTVDPRGLRYPSYFHDPQKYEQFLAMLSFLFLLNDKNVKNPGFNNYLLFSVVIVAMLATGGRSAFIGLGAGLLLLFIFLGVRYKFMMIAVCLIAGMLVLNFSDRLLILQRSATFNEDYLFRASLWNEAYLIFTKHPLFGIGTGNFHNYAVSFSNNYFINASNEVVFFEQPESGYWLLLTEMGILGFIISLLFIAVPIFNSFKHYFKGNSLLTIPLLVAPIISWIVSFSSVYSLADKRILILVITFICLLITSYNPRIRYGIQD